MGLFRRKSKEPKEPEGPPQAPEIDLAALTVKELPSGWRIPVAGAHLRQEAIEAAQATASPDRPKDIGGPRRHKDADSYATGWTTAIITPDRANKADPNAVAVFHKDGGHLGFLSAKYAKDFQVVFDYMADKWGADAGECPAYFRGPGDHTAVILCLDGPVVLLDDEWNAPLKYMRRIDPDFER